MDKYPLNNIPIDKAIEVIQLLAKEYTSEASVLQSLDLAVQALKTIDDMHKETHTRKKHVVIPFNAHADGHFYEQFALYYNNYDSALSSAVSHTKLHDEVLITTYEKYRLFKGDYEKLKPFSLSLYRGIDYYE